MNLPEIARLYFWLFGAHLLCDFSLQSDTMAREKNRNARTPLQKHIPWWYWLLAHSFIHGMAVALVTGSISLGVAELLLHAGIDCAKCERWINIHADQFLHLFCKALWAYALLMAPVPPW